LTLAGYYLKKKEFLDKAVHFLEVWFINDETKMNPNLNYAQAIPGVSKGRGIGIIDTKALISLIYCFDFLCEYQEYAILLEQLKQWFSEYINWLDTSKNGIDERDYFNNHANWWNAQVAAFSSFTDNQEMLNNCFERFRTITVPNQMDTDGSFIDEMTRTRSFSYNLFNLEGLSVIAEIAFQKKIDLWGFETADHKGIKSGIEFLKPYVRNPYLWKNPQITGESVGDQFAFQLGAVRLSNSDYQKANLDRRKIYI